MVECILQMNGVRMSYGLNGTETQQIWMALLGPEWHLVRGNFQPMDGQGLPLAADSQELQVRLQALLDRIRERYRRRANYTEVGKCAQKEGEGFDDYKVRMESVFRQYSGLPVDDNPQGPYLQQQTNPTKKFVQMGRYIEPWTNSCLNRRDGRTGTTDMYLSQNR